MDLEVAISLVNQEYNRAVDLHGKFHDAHHGYSVLLEEVDELWAEVKRKPRSAERMQKEAVHVVAMAIRFLVDVC